MATHLTTSPGGQRDRGHSRTPVDRHPADAANRPVQGDLQYLLTMRREAELPQVRWGITQPAFADVTGEVRSHIAGRPEFVRILS